MSLILTNHLRKQMVRRQITERDVRAALADPLTEWVTQENSVQYVGRTPGGRELKVWVVSPGLSARHPIVKSAAWKDR